MRVNFPEIVVLAAVVMPLLAFLVIGSHYLITRRPSEFFVNTYIAATMAMSFTLSVLLGAMFFISRSEDILINFGTWYEIGSYKFSFVFLLDSLSIPVLILSNFLIGIVGHFSSRYLHRDEGFLRFFLLYLLFAGGMSLVITAATLDLILAGWELVGISSAFLIGFYQHRKGPVENGIRAFVYYRVCDLGLLMAAAMWHSIYHSENLSILGGHHDWIAHTVGYAPTALCVSLVLASLAKSAQLPMSAWLPRAMEGPTPSSAIFYGALSVHAGAYLLLRTYPLFEHQDGLKVVIGAIGLATALYGAFYGRARNDIKTVLAYASMSQVGVIFVEISLGWVHLALWHLIGHSLLRSWQFLSAPSLLYDIQKMHLPLNKKSFLQMRLPSKVVDWLYRQSLDGRYLENLMVLIFIKPILRLAKAADRLENMALVFFEDKSRPNAKKPHQQQAFSENMRAVAEEK